MTPERRLADNIKRLSHTSLWLTQGEVTATDGITCSVKIGDAELSEIRLRASLTDNDRNILVVPKVGTSVVLGCISGDYNNMVVLQIDEIDSITINGGELGGLIKIKELTDKLNALVDQFNNHTHTLPPGAVVTPAGPNANPITVPAITSKANNFNAEDYEDELITH